MEPNILVVDDDSQLRAFVTEVLSGSYSNLLTAANGREAEAIVFSQPVDLVVSDIKMPGMDGLELVKHLEFVNRDIKCILMTGYHKPENITFCLESGVSRYIKKPFRAKELLTLVEEVLADKGEGDVKLQNTGVNDWLELSLSSTEQSMLKVCNYVKQYIEDHVTGDDVNSIYQAFYEMIRNALEWGNHLNKQFKVIVGCLFLEDKVVFKIQDQGGGFDIDKELNSVENPLEKQKTRQKHGKRPGGLGITMVRNIMDTFFYNEKGNCMIMTKNFNIRHQK